MVSEVFPYHSRIAGEPGDPVRGEDRVPLSYLLDQMRTLGP